MRLVAVLLLVLGGCRIGYEPLGAGAPDAASCADSSCRFSVGGTASGVSGALEIENNGSDRLTLTESGTFTFAERLAADDPYDVVVTIAPSDSACSVSNGNGVIGSADVTDVEIACTPITTDGIRCGAGICDDTLEECCHDEVGPGGTCTPTADTCGADQVAMECDDPSDCAGDNCCVYVDPGGQLVEAACEPACRDQGPITPLTLCVPTAPSPCTTGNCEFSAERNFFYCQ